MIKSKGKFPENTDIPTLIEFYYQMFSIEMNCKSMAIIAATLANGGVCPITNEVVFSTNTTRAVLSMMYSCGMHEQSGQFAYTIGLPAKSAGNGIMLLVVPGVCGFCIYSPKVIGYVSVRGYEFAKRLVDRFIFHNFDNSSTCDTLQRIDPTKEKKKYNQQLIIEFIYACAENDINLVNRFIHYGIGVNNSDYDFRTPLHVACSEGHYDIVKTLLENGANPLLKDRWNNTSLDDAIRNTSVEGVAVVELLQKYIDNNRANYEAAIKES
jgi:glutaminase